MELRIAMESRTSTRAFLPRIVEREKVEDLLKMASLSPSAINLQPWELVVVAGREKEMLSRVILKAYRERSVPCGPGAVKSMPPEFYERQKETFKAMVSHIEEAGFEFDSFINEGSCRFYDAPVALLLFMDEAHPDRRMVDIGIFTGYLCLMAESLGLGTCPIGLLRPYTAVIGDFLHVPEGKRFILGVALGYSDPDSPVMETRTSRAPLHEFVKWVY